MALDRSLIGQPGRGDSTLYVDAGRLRFFAKATGQRDPIYTDLDAAAAAGHPDLPAPPTFAFSVALEQPDSFRWLAEAGVDLRSILHGAQEFTYHRMAYAGDTLTVRGEIVDIYEKKNGALEFIVQESTVTNQRDEVVATLKGITIVQHKQEAA